MKKMLLPLLLFSAMFMCCKNWDFNGDPPKEYPPQGHVLEYSTENPIPGATVYQSECEGQVFGNLNCWTIDSATTDAQGHYAFTIPGGLTVNAQAAGYFSSDLQPILSGGATPADITLYPHAWLKVVIKNESGAYGFFPPSEGSGYPPIQLEQGRDSTLELDLRKGNDTTTYIFSVRTEQGGTFPGPDYWQNVKAFANGSPVNVRVGVGAFLDFYLAGHDTTFLSIIY